MHVCTYVVLVSYVCLLVGLYLTYVCMLAFMHASTYMYTSACMYICSMYISVHTYVIHMHMSAHEMSFQARAGASNIMRTCTHEILYACTYTSHAFVPMYKIHT